MAQARGEPTTRRDATSTSSSPPPLPLLIVDLNETLVFRGGGGRVNATTASKNPIRRPYLSSFLQYCLGLSDASYVKQRWRRGGGGDGGEQAQQQEQDSSSDEGGEAANSAGPPALFGGGGADAMITPNIDEKAAKRRGRAWERTQVLRNAIEAGEAPHGSHFWNNKKEAVQEADAAVDDDSIVAATAAATLSSSPPSLPSPHPSASTRLLVWSSAQPGNVDSMVRAILHPLQAAQLVRCWARDTLVPPRLASFKSPSVKDLEIVWDALNLSEWSRDARGELRVQAANRDDDGGGEGENKDVSEGQAGTRATPVYGQHNTLLLDDSAEKARLQPYNHLLIPAFGKEAALAVKAAREQQSVGVEGSAQLAASLDTVLLQAIGVLEHARWQHDVSRWIYHGGLGQFAGNDAGGGDGSVGSDVGAGTDGEDRPRLDAPHSARTTLFWEEEGRRALRVRGIPLVV